MDEFLCSIPFIIKSSYSSTQLLDNLAKIRLLYDSYKVFEYFFFFLMKFAKDWNGRNVLFLITFRLNIGTSLRLGICIVCYVLPIPLLNPGIILLNSRKKGGNAWRFHLILLYLQQVFKRFSILSDCMNRKKRLKEQKSLKSATIIQYTIKGRFMSR